MTDNDRCSTFERCCKAAIIGCVIPFSVVIFGIATSLCKDSLSLEVWGMAVEFLVISLIPAAVAGGVGGAAKNYGHASAWGAIIFLCVAGEYIWFGCWNTWSVVAQILVFALVVGALSGGVGAVIGRTAPATDEEPRRLRISLLELLITGFLGVILLTYLSWRV